jgi:cell wall-associated NlpC family hydrolase
MRGFYSLSFFICLKGGFMMKTSEILPGDILFCSGKGIIKSLIEWITHSKYYHTAIFINDHDIIEAQGGRKSGKTDISYYLNTKDKLVIYRDKSLLDSERKKIVEYALAHQGIEYDYMAILAELFRYEMHISLDDYDEGKKRICSSFVNDCFKSIGKSLSKQKVPSPQDLILEKHLSRIGKLKKK